MRLYGFGECLPDASNRVELDPDVVDAWGIPVLRISCRWGENERAMFDDMADSAAEMLEAAGVRNVEVFHEDNPPGKTIHEMGTARMGSDPATSVLNAFNQAHDVANLFVVDGSCMVSSANQNPSLTYMALTARACAYAVGRVESTRAVAACDRCLVHSEREEEWAFSGSSRSSRPPPPSLGGSSCTRVWRVRPWGPLPSTASRSCRSRTPGGTRRDRICSVACTPGSSRSSERLRRWMSCPPTRSLGSPDRIRLCPRSCGSSGSMPSSRDRSARCATASSRPWRSWSPIPSGWSGQPRTERGPTASQELTGRVAAAIIAVIDSSRAGVDPPGGGRDR